MVVLRMFGGFLQAIEANTWTEFFHMSVCATSWCLHEEIQIPE